MVPGGQRVVYLLSKELLTVADALPSNLGRSTWVHSLIYHLDLLDLPRLSAFDNTHRADSDSSEATSTTSSVGGDEDQGPLVQALALHADLEEGDDHPIRRRAQVVAPERASPAQLRMYHSEDYLEALLSRRCEQKGRTSAASSARQAEGERYGLLDDCPHFKQLKNYVELIAGGSLTAARLLAEDKSDVAIFWDGGRHHAHRARAAGFCYINDVVLAIMELKRPRKASVNLEARPLSEYQSLQKQTVREETGASPALGFGSRPEDVRREYSANSTNPLRKSRKTEVVRPVTGHSQKRRTILKRLERVLYLDLDVHWGDGVDEAFADSMSVFTVSVHNRSPGFYPCPPELVPDGTEEKSWCGHGPARTRTTMSSFNVPLHPGLRDDAWKEVWISSIFPVLCDYEPEAIVVQCGLDGLAGDPIGQWNLSLAALVRSVSDVLAWASNGAAVRPAAEYSQHTAKGAAKFTNRGMQESVCKVLLLGGGGYNSCNAARGWAALTALALGRSNPEGADDNVSGDSRDDETNAAIQRLLSTPIPWSHPRWPEFDRESQGDGGREGMDDDSGVEGKVISPKSNTLNVSATPRPDTMNDAVYLSTIEAASRMKRLRLLQTRADTQGS